jgi:hypothetical protein
MLSLFALLPLTFIALSSIVAVVRGDVSFFIVNAFDNNMFFTACANTHTPLSSSPATRVCANASAPFYAYYATLTLPTDSDYVFDLTATSFYANNVTTPLDSYTFPTGNITSYSIIAVAFIQNYTTSTNQRILAMEGVSGFRMSTTGPMALEANFFYEGTLSDPYTSSTSVNGIAFDIYSTDLSTHPSIAPTTLDFTSGVMYNLAIPPPETSYMYTTNVKVSWEYLTGEVIISEDYPVIYAGPGQIFATMSLGYVLPNDKGSSFNVLVLSPPVEYYPPTLFPTSMPTISLAPTLPSETDSSDNNNGLSAREIAGITIGVIIACGIIAGAVYFLFFSGQGNKANRAENMQTSLIDRL